MEYTEKWVKKTTEDCIKWIQDWFEKNGKDCNAVIGISGGKDSSVVAALCVEALGKDRVIGVMMPNGVQSDIADSEKIIKHLGIKSFRINIGQSYLDILEQIPESSYQTKVNLAPRIRMATLYAISQSNHGRVLNTCNLSETETGWETRWGDSVGDLSPIGGLTKTEVVEIGKYLKLPIELVEKAPADGLTNKTDEDNFGFTYEELDSYLRGENLDKISQESINKICDLQKKSEFKRKPIPVFKPKFV